MRIVLAVVALVAVSFATVSADGTGTPSSPALSATPAVAPAGTVRQLQGTGFPASATLPLILLYPSGAQTVAQAQTDASGQFTAALLQSATDTPDGPYRAVVGLPDHGAVSTTFVIGDGKPHLYESPDRPSPTSAINITGTGLPAGSGIDVVLSLTGGLGDRTFHVTTDPNGTFSLYVWPQQLGWGFFSAGYYAASIPSQGLSVRFPVQEHPFSADIAVTGPAVVDQTAAVRFLHYGAGRYLWGVYATADGSVAGEFLTGQTDVIGNLVTTIPIAHLPAGAALIATPYEWGEAGFAVVDPTPMPTATPTRTPRPTPRPTATPVRKPTPKPVKKVCRRDRHGKKICKKKKR